MRTACRWQLPSCLLFYAACATQPTSKPAVKTTEPVQEQPATVAMTPPTHFPTTAAETNSEPVIAEEAFTFSDPNPAEDSAEDRLQRLDQATAKQADREALVADIRAVMEAEAFDELGDYEQSVNKWHRALELSRGSLGRRALRGWVLAYYQLLEKNQSPEVVAQALLKDLNNGKASPYLAEAGLSKIEPLSGAIKDILHLPDASEVIVASGSSFSPPSDTVFPADDPTLETAAKTFCLDENADMIAVDIWLTKLPGGVRQYWEALVAHCGEQTREALNLVRDAIPVLFEQPQAHSIAVRAVELEIDWLKEQGERKAMVASYTKLVDAYNLPGVTPPGLGVDTFQLHLKRIDATLSAARYHTLTPDYKTARALVEKALQDISNVTTKATTVAGFSLAKLDELKADALHVLAFRIAVEERKYDEAIRATEQGLALPEINSEWRERLLWNHGLYLFMSGKLNDAATVWEQLLSMTKADSSTRPALLFWLARTYENRSDPARVEGYLKQLQQEQPFSYYAVVAQAHLKQPSVYKWEQPLAQIEKLSTVLAQNQDLNEAAILSDATLGREWQRIKLVVQSRLEDFYTAVFDQVGKNLRKARKLDASNAAYYVYYTRLAAAANRHHEAIQTTQQLSLAVPNFWELYPSQVLISFPIEFEASITKFSKILGVRSETIAAISKQESSFNPDVKSPAGAIGLMQLMPATAEKVARERAFVYEDIQRSLRRPDFNIAAGTAYLADLQKIYGTNSLAIYAAYNAGEPAVTSWLKQRPMEDPLIWLELIPYSETRGYVKNVWRNWVVYSKLLKSKDKNGS